MSEETAAEPEVETLAFDVSDEEAGARLDALLAARVEGVSRTTIKRLIEDGDATVAGHAVKPSHKVRAGDRVELELNAPPPLDLEPEDIPLDIVHEDDDLIVVNKPAGMVVHPAAGVSRGTLANAVAYRLLNTKEEGATLRRGDEAQEAAFSSTVTTSQRRNVSSSQRPGIVHRLDRDTSGLIVVAKNAFAHEHLAEQFRARTVFKAYVALVYGRMKEDAGRVEQPVARDPRHRTRMAVVRGGREAVTLWRARRRYDRFTLLDVKIKTGRTHQIRVHLAFINHPVAGDETYGMGRDRNLADPRLRAALAALNRQFLHAEQLAFTHPRTGERLRFTAPLPADLKTFLEELEGAAPGAA